VAGNVLIILKIIGMWNIVLLESSLLGMMLLRKNPNEEHFGSVETVNVYSGIWDMVGNPMGNYLQMREKYEMRN